MPKSRSQVYSRYLRGREVGHRRSLCLSRDPLTSKGAGRKGVLASAVVERLYREGHDSGEDVMHSEFSCSCYIIYQLSLAASQLFAIH